MAKNKDNVSVENASVEQKKPAKPQKAKKADKNKKPNIFVRFGRKIKETFSELKRVSWPSFGKTLKSTGVVLGIVLIFVVFVTAFNSGFGALLELITKWGA
ncbi:MAG: preprotein translocase subunit SecE [Clostridia bacterium]|jgi:preprotein translocase SecE subunit|nr:preprotein translocase subunit SecE [Clostridia bacterium]